MAALIGRPHLLGRMKPLRNRFLVEPISVLTLQQDGKLGGEHLLHQRGWAPYGHGDVAAAEAFALLTEPNGWIPSSTWTQSMGDILIGYFCDEPEADLAVQRLCLIPNELSDNASGIVYLVASCLSFYDRTVPPLLVQL